MREFLKRGSDETPTITELIHYLSQYDGNLLVVGGWESQLKAVRFSLSEVLDPTTNKYISEPVLVLDVD